jgi:benzoyl-CoA reductase subunit A
MRCVTGIDLGSTTTKAVLLDERGALLGRGITNSRSNYAIACAVAREEGHIAARFELLRRGLRERAHRMNAARPQDGLVDAWLDEVHEAFRLERHLAELEGLRAEVSSLVASPLRQAADAALAHAATATMDDVLTSAPNLFGKGRSRRSDFFRDLAGEAFMAAAERVSNEERVPFERLVGLFDRAILRVETSIVAHDFGALLSRAAHRVASSLERGDGELRELFVRAAEACAREPIEEVAMAGTGYGRQTLPFPKEAVRSEILCHGRGAHHMFPGTRTVLDIGGQDTKAIQIDERGLVSSFQMNDRCAAGCGRYLGYIADELNLGLHELGPLALNARRTVKVSSTCTVFAGAELRERLALGERREDILAGLHRSIMLRAMSLLARSGGVHNELTFTGGVCKNPMATKILRELVDESYGPARAVRADQTHAQPAQGPSPQDSPLHAQDSGNRSTGIVINLSPDSIYMGALGAALFALDDARAGRESVLPDFALGKAGARLVPDDPGAPHGIGDAMGGPSCAH